MNRQQPLACYSGIRSSVRDDDMYTPERHIPTHQDSTSCPPQRHTAAGTAAPTTTDRRTQSHSAPTPLKRPMLAPEGLPRPRVNALARGRWSVFMAFDRPHHIFEYSQTVNLHRAHAHTRTGSCSESGVGSLRGAPFDISRCLGE